MSGEVLIEFMSANGHAQALGANAFGLGLLTHGAITLVNDGQTHPQPMVTGSVTVAGTNPVLAFKANQQVNVYGVAGSGSNFTFHFRAQSSVALGLQYWVFDAAAQAMRDPTLADVEAAIFDEHGVKTFDLTMLFMNVADIIETPSPANEIPNGGGHGNMLGEHVDLAVPTGRTYAVVQSTPFFLTTTFDTGSYGNGQYPPELNVGDGEPPVGMTWRHQTLECYFSTGGYVNASTIRAGITRFEFWQSWNTASSQPHLNMDGECRHLVIDVTGLPSTPLPNPNTPNVSISAATRSVSVSSATAVTTDTPAVSVTITGGTAPYSISWVRQSGSTTVAANGSTTSTSFSTRVVNQAPGTSVSAIYVANVTDAVGATRSSDPVTFTHAVVLAADPNLDPLDWANCSFTTNDNIGAGSNAALTISGITQQVNLRFTLSNVTSNFSGGDFYIYRNNVRSRGANGFGNGYWTDVDVVNGDQVFFYYDGVTTSGRRTLTGTITVTNTTTDAIVDTFTIGGTLDNDDDWNNAPAPDYTPVAITLTDQSIVSDHWEAHTAGSFFTISGINQPITVRITRGTTTDYDYIFTRRLVIGKSTDSGITWTETNMGALSAPLDFTANNGDRFFLKGYFSTNGGRGSTTWPVTVTNATTGVQMGTLTVSGTVDNNNDYDRVRITFDGCTLDTTEPAGNTTYSQRTISGLLRPHVLRFTRDDVNTMFMEGNIIYGRQIIGHNMGGVSAWTWHTLGAGVGAAVEFTVNNGDLIYVHGYVETSAGAARAAWSTYMSDLTTGEYIGSWYTNGLVDNDNNFNVVGPPVVTLSTYYLDPGHEFSNSGVNRTINVGQTTATVSGGTAPFAYLWERINGTSAWTIGAPTSSTTDFRITQRTNFTATGDFRLRVTDAQARVAHSDLVSCFASAGDTEA